MKFLKAVVPNLCIALWLALLTLAILDVYNPMMGFLKGKPFLVLLFLCAAASITSAVMLYRSWRRAQRRKHRKQQVAAPSREDAL